MVPLLIPIRRLLLFLILVQSASLYKLYASDDDHSNLLSDSLSSPFDEEINQLLHIKNNGYDDEDVVFDTNNDENKDNLTPWLSLASEMRQQKPFWKRSMFSTKPHSSKALPQRRNNRPHWNPLVAAYKRCGELSTREERESCFKDAIQMLFVHKLRK